MLLAVLSVACCLHTISCYIVALRYLLFPTSYILRLLLSVSCCFLVFIAVCECFLLLLIVALCYLMCWLLTSVCLTILCFFLPIHNSLYYNLLLPYYQPIILGELLKNSFESMHEIS